MNRRFLLVALSALLLGVRALAAVSLGDEPKVDLAPRLVAGQENRFQVRMVSRTTTQFLDTVRVRLQEYQQTLRIQRKVVSVEPAGATLELTYERVIVTLIAANKSITLDTESTANTAEAEELLGATARNALNRPFTVKVDKFGRVLGVSGNEQDESKKAAVNLIDTELFMRHLTPIYGLAKEPALTAAGEHWSSSYRTKPSKTGVFVITTDSRLVSLSGDRADIEVGGNVSVEFSELAVNGKSELASQSVTGQQLWNVANGIIDRSFYQHTIAVTADVEAKQVLQEVGEVRRRRADMLMYVAIDRIDDGVAPLPPLPPIPEAVAAPVTPGSPRQQPAPGAAKPPNPAATGEME